MVPQRAWKDWNEVYRTTYPEYVRNYATRTSLDGQTIRAEQVQRP